MQENIRKKLARNWFLTIQELICHEIENIENELQKMVTAEVVETSLNDYAANFVTQEMIANFVTADVVEGSLN